MFKPHLYIMLRKDVLFDSKKSCLMLKCLYTNADGCYELKVCVLQIFMS